MSYEKEFKVHTVGRSCFTASIRANYRCTNRAFHRIKAEYLLRTLFQCSNILPRYYLENNA